MNRLVVAKELLDTACKLSEAKECESVPRMLAIIASAVLLGEEGLLLNTMVQFKEKRIKEIGEKE